MRLRHLLGVISIGFVLIGAAHAGSPHRESVGFSFTQDVGLGRSVYVVGSHPDIGSWNPVNAVRLRWTPGNVWTGSVAIQAGTELEYKSIARTNSIDSHCDVGNATWQSGPNLTLTVPAQPPAPYAGKTIYYHSSWTNASILYRLGTSEDFVNVPMEQVGPGRSPEEYLYRVSGIATAGEPIEFAPNGYLDGQEYWDNAPYPGYGDEGNNYFTPLDHIFLQDGHIFNYRPPASLSVPQFITNQVDSTVANIQGRRVRVLLPRGYEENTWKRYPVLYLHDGQNVYAPGGIGSWDTEVSTIREVSQGRMREVILVAIDNTNDRLADYCPPGDVAAGSAGKADLYYQYLINDVRAYVDTTFRTLTDPANTGLMGSSMGGLVSAYVGLEAGDEFGLIGAMSSSFWTATNFVTRLGTIDTSGVRIYMDAGTGEQPSVWRIWDVYNQLLADGYSQNAEMWTVIECGTGHNEAAWRGRYPAAARYLFNLLDEANLLAYEDQPLHMELMKAATTPDWLVRFTALHGWQYDLEESTSLTLPDWSEADTTSIERMPWQEREMPFVVGEMPGPRYYRLRASSPGIEP